MCSIRTGHEQMPRVLAHDVIRFTPPSISTPASWQKDPAQHGEVLVWAWQLFLQHAELLAQRERALSSI